MTSAANDPLLVIAHGAVRSDAGHEHVELYWPDAGRRITLGVAMMRVVTEFAIPDSAQAVVRRVCGDERGSDEALRRAIDSLVKAGVLCESTPVQPPAATRRTGMFGAPVSDLASALNANADFVVVGAPHDHGASYRPGSRFGPESLRRVSTGVHRIDSASRGAFDPEQGRRLLEGVSVLDIGDLVGTLGDLGRDLLNSLEDTVAVLTARGLTPVVLGGDHSITLRIVDGLTRHHEKVGVLHLDAHYDHGAVRTGLRDTLHHGNFLDWVVGNPRVECVAQLGIRQLVADPPASTATVLRWPGRSALEVPTIEIVSALPPDLVWHISFDVDVLDPTVMPATGTLLPGGWSYHDAVAILGGLADVLPVVSIDLVEFLPGADEAPAITISALLLRLMDRIAIARREHPNMRALRKAAP